MAPLTITVGKELFPLPKHQFMQFYEPLGMMDASVEATWDYATDDFNAGFMEVAKELAPTMIRWPGGCYSSYYKWREGVGPAESRQWMHNVLWGGKETNRVGTHEAIDFCRRVGADPLLTVNFECDGRMKWAEFRGSDRLGTPEEAAAWVDYCNNPSSRDRRNDGAVDPFSVSYWQIGNETSYSREGYDLETTAARTKVFVKAMRDADRAIKLIAWGCSGWAPRMIEVLGESIDYVAFHHHFPSGIDNSPLSWQEFRRNPELTFHHLLNACHLVERRIGEMREQIDGSAVKLALTESHFGLQGRNRADVLATWGAGVAYARVLNVHERNGDVLHIATMADFVGTRIASNALIIDYPARVTYMMPVARIMQLYRHGRGTTELEATSSGGDLDVTASIAPATGGGAVAGETRGAAAGGAGHDRADRGARIFLHVVNTRFADAVSAQIDLGGRRAKSGTVKTIALDPMLEFNRLNKAETAPVARLLPSAAPDATAQVISFPAASVSVVELELA